MSATLTYPSRTYHPLGLVWRSLAVGLGYVVFSMLGGMLDAALRLPAMEIGIHIDMTQILMGMFAGGIVMGLTLGPLTTRLALPVLHRTAVLFVLIYGVMTFLTAVEGLFFTTFTTPTQLYRPSVLLTHLLLAGLIAWLYRPSAPERPLGARLGETLTQRGWLDWLWRFVLAGVLYVPTYLGFGMLIAPIVMPYYNAPSLGLGLVVPGFEIMIPLEVVRGLLYVVAVFPLVAVLQGPRWQVALWVGLTIAVLQSWAPMLQGAFLPLTLRVVHGLEITADAFVQGLTIAWLLGMQPWRAPQTSHK